VNIHNDILSNGKNCRHFVVIIYEMMKVDSSSVLTAITVRTIRMLIVFLQSADIAVFCDEVVVLNAVFITEKQCLAQVVLIEMEQLINSHPAVFYD